MTGDRLAGLNFTGLSSGKPVLLIIGGSMGSVKVNTAIRNILPELLAQFQVIHLCGKGHLDESLRQTGYVQYEYIGAELKDIFALADVVVSRAGANSICELLALRKPNLLIPLSAAASRGDQILNARSFSKQGFSTVLEEEDITDERLLDMILDLYNNHTQYILAMEQSKQGDAIKTICDLLDDACKNV
jgi:UDP-N-acetylglucosamine--N-acetylmuramyl-(pentapeptide) pyrophosphoryl-undecaprenol N-acetylglucosamine transferase